jgi:hypothetical protein
MMSGTLDTRGKRESDNQTRDLGLAGVKQRDRVDTRTPVRGIPTQWYCIGW